MKKYVPLMLAALLSACTTLGEIYDATPIIGKNSQVNQAVTVTTPTTPVITAPTVSVVNEQENSFPFVEIPTTTKLKTATVTKTTRTSQIATATKTSKPTPVSFQCGTKRTCSQMKSCKEAKYFLNQCGVQRLDRDGDGVPCENLCGG